MSDIIKADHILIAGGPLPFSYNITVGDTKVLGVQRVDITLQADGHHTATFTVKPALLNLALNLADAVFVPADDPNTPATDDPNGV